jgi:stage III sporulation protein AA
MTVPVLAKEIFPLLPGELRKILGAENKSVQETVEEIRLVVNQPLYIYYGGKEKMVPGDGSQKPYLVSREDVSRIVQIISKFSLYAFEDELKHGYITIPGGHRVGLTGRTVLEGGRVRRLCSISSINIRVARQVLDAAKPLLPYLVERGRKNLCHTLIVSAPRRGKTTLLRDMARTLSSGSSLLPPLRVGIVDERSELCGCYQGVPQLDVGPRTDVLDACPKAEGMMMLIRAMGPEVIITDEIGREEDVFALREALNAGVVVVTSAHAGSFADLQGRPVFQRILAEGFFQRFVFLGTSRGIGTVETILDRGGKPIHRGGMLTCSS